MRNSPAGNQAHKGGAGGGSPGTGTGIARSLWLCTSKHTLNDRLTVLPLTSYCCGSAQQLSPFRQREAGSPPATRCGARWSRSPQWQPWSAHTKQVEGGALKEAAVGRAHARASFWQELWPTGDLCWNRLFLKDHPSKRRIHFEAVYERLYPIEQTPCWSRAIVRRGRKQRGNVTD